MTIHSIARPAPEDDAIIPSWTLGDRMRKALEVTGTPVQEIADYLDVNRNTISRWLHDKTPVKRHVLIVWAATTGVDLGWLETGTAGLENQTGRERYAIRDSNPEPADMESGRSGLRLASVNGSLTADRRAAGAGTIGPSRSRHPLVCSRIKGAARPRHLSLVGQAAS